MSIKIEAKEQNIGEIFGDAYEFEIPPYQRPYAWEEDQARELLTDLLDAMDDQDVSGGLYFLGSIVLVKTPTNAQSKVIDGQQRLTTLTILLSILRDLTNDQEVRFERRTYIYQKASADKGLQERCRLLLRKSDRPFFLKQVQNPNATNSVPDPTKLEGSHRRIAEAVQYLRSHLEVLSEDRRNALTAFVIQKCYLVVVAVPTADAARRIFTVLNARGLDLTATDILKADLLDRAAASQEESLASRWEAVETALGRERMVELFGHIRMIYEREKPRLALELGFKKFVTPFDGSADDFISHILEPLADALIFLSDPARVHKLLGNEAAKAVRSLDRIDNKDWMPPALLRVWEWQPQEKLTVATYLIELERLAYFLFVTRAGVNDRIERYSAVMDAFKPRPDHKLPSIGLSLSGEEQYRFVKALAGPLYLMTRVCKPVLQRLDEALSSGGASYDELVSIEHVLPQTVEEGSEWATLFPNEQERSAWTHRLANLVFLTRRINTKASNWDFEKKKKEYFGSSDGSSPFVITQGVLQTEQWTPEHLAKRQTQLLERLSSVWQLNPPENIEELSEPDDPPGEWHFTDAKLIEAKREKIMQALSVREDVTLSKKGALCWSADNTLHAVCTSSKRYGKNRPPYWYGYHPDWRKFLSKAQDAFLVLGCMDRNIAFTVPFEELEKILDSLYRTPNKHWHLALGEDDVGALHLLTKTGKKIPLTKYEMPLEKD